MGDFSLSVQRYVQASCIECEETQTFTMVSGDKDAAVARFECDECSHPLTVNLDP